MSFNLSPTIANDIYNMSSDLSLKIVYGIDIMSFVSSMAMLVMMMLLILDFSPTFSDSYNVIR